MTTTETTPEPEAPRVPERCWCPKLQAFVPRTWVAVHLETVHGVNRKMVMQAYGGNGNRRGL
jgi:hypothetical protein